MSLSELSNPKDISDIDKVIGGKINKQRISSGLTIKQFAEQIGVTHQQAHKYEKGMKQNICKQAL